MAAAPWRVLRALLQELRYLGPESGHYRRTAGYKYITEQFRKNQVTSEKLCRAQQELLHQASTYLCLLQSVRHHQALHQVYHSKGELSPQQVSQQVGFKLPQQPGGKGWEE